MGSEWVVEMENYDRWQPKTAFFCEIVGQREKGWNKIVSNKTPRSKVSLEFERQEKMEEVFFSSKCCKVCTRFLFQ